VTVPQPQTRHPAYELNGRHPAIRLLMSQQISSDVYLQGEPPPTPRQIAAVLHALADHTHNRHMLSDAVASLGEERNPFGDKSAHITGLGRYFHGLGDYLDAQ
jgi:hypothetical protein